MRSKYRAEKVLCSHGHKHDSKREAKRCDLLNKMLEQGEISDLKQQVSYELIPKQTETIQRVGKRGQPLKPKEVTVERGCSYKADFVYKDKNGNLVVEDCKGMRTTEYKIKRKLMLYVHKIKIVET
jgi:hypothetical protein